MDLPLLKNYITRFFWEQDACVIVKGWNEDFEKNSLELDSCRHLAPANSI